MRILLFSRSQCTVDSHTHVLKNIYNKVGLKNLILIYFLQVIDDNKLADDRTPDKGLYEYFRLISQSEEMTHEETCLVDSFS